MSEFKKFIETGGKTLDEIKKNINDIIGKAAKTIIDDTTIVPKEARNKLKNAISGKIYTAEKIPPKKRELDYIDDKSSGKLTVQNPIAYPREAVPERLSRQAELMLDRIREMRALEDITQSSYIARRSAEITLIRQGEFMAEIEDDFERAAYCALPRPVYAAMSNSQLRTYFTWRTDVRRGVYRDTEKPYVILYCFELMNKIGVLSSEDAFGELVELWENMRNRARFIDDILPRWIKDFYAFNSISAPLPRELTDEDFGDPANADIGRAVSDIENGCFDNKLNFLADYSAYNIKGSIFLSEETRPLFNGALAEALSDLERYFSERDAKLSELLCGKMKRDYSWEPFADSLAALDRQDGFRAVEISHSERYCLKRGKPTLVRFDFSPCKGFVGFVLKSVEAELRKRTGFKRTLIPNIAMVESDVKNRDKLWDAVFAEEFKEIIPRAVGRYCDRKGILPKKARKNPDETIVYTRQRVEIDISKLESIREQSDEIAKKLIVDDELSYEEIVRKAEIISDDEFEERVAEFAVMHKENPEPESADNVWERFSDSLSDEQAELILRLLDGSLSEFCRERNILPEAVFEEINSLALETVGDVVIENREIVPDYESDIKTALKLSE